MKKILIILIIAAVIIGGLIYFLRNPAKTPSSGQPQFPEVSSGVQTYDVAVVNFSFSPAALDIKKGDRVVWTNQDSSTHSISGNDFESKILNKGESFSFTFDSAGAYDYICGIHPYMSGQVLVK